MMIFCTFPHKYMSCLKNGYHKNMYHYTAMYMFINLVLNILCLLCTSSSKKCNVVITNSVQKSKEKMQKTGAEQTL